MSENERYEIDKFQMSSYHLSAAIAGYFRDEHPASVLHLVQACNDLTKDIAKYYAGNKALTMGRIKFWSNRHFLNSGSEDGQFFRGLGRYVKHADRDTLSAQIITSQIVTPYLLATVVDFQQLKSKLLEHGVADRTRATDFNGGRERPPVSWKNFWRYRNEHLAEALYDRPPRVDVLSSLFLSWYEATKVPEDISPLDSGNEFAEDLIPYPLSAFSRVAFKMMALREKWRDSSRPVAVVNEVLRLSTKPVVLLEARLLQSAKARSDASHYYLKSVEVDGEVVEKVPNEMFTPIFET